MRIAVLVISLVLMLVVFVQSCTVTAGGELGEDEGLSEGGSVGIFVALLYLVGGALVLGYPRASMVVFGVAALIGIVGGATTDFTDLVVWGVVAGILAIMSYFGYRGKRKDALAAATSGGGSAAIPASDPSDTKVCPECAERVQAAAKVCRFCGHRFDGSAAESAETSSE